MQMRIIIAIIFLAALLCPGLTTAAIPTPIDGQITDLVSLTVSDRINVPDMTAAGAWNNRIWGNGEILA